MRARIISLGMSTAPTAIVALLSAAAGGVIIVGYLIRRPVLDLRVKLWLLVGLGVLPVLSAGSSTAAGMKATTERTFCGSCHVMGAHYGDTTLPESQSLAARHSRNPQFGDQSCYVCHADYGMYGYVMTKKAGLRHVYEYYLGGYKQMTLDEATRAIHLLKPYDNHNCRQCHTTTLQDWRRVPEHGSLAAELESNRVSCASAGCHGYAHPFTKTDVAASHPTMAPSAVPSVRAP